MPTGAVDLPGAIMEWSTAFVAPARLSNTRSSALSSKARPSFSSLATMIDSGIPPLIIVKTAATGAEGAGGGAVTGAGAEVAVSFCPADDAGEPVFRGEVWANALSSRTSETAMARTPGRCGVDCM